MKSIEAKNKVEIERNTNIDVLKGICIFMVIFTHTAVPPAIRNTYFSWSIATAVPIFMVLTGYNYAMSAKLRKIEKVWDWYTKENFNAKFSRIFWAYMVAFVFDFIAYIGVDKLFDNSVNLKDFIRIFSQGGVGPGSYYVPIMLQLLLVFPFILICFQWNHAIGSIIVLSFNLLFEIFVNHFAIDANWYRLCSIRYFAFIVFGIFLFYYKDRLNTTFIIPIFFTVGLYFLINITYLGYKTVIFKQWVSTSLPTAFYAVALVAIFMKLRIPNWINKTIGKIGRASYHIFLTQMVYFAFRGVSALAKSKSWGFNIILSMVVCCAIGLLFYSAEVYIRKCLKSRKLHVH